MAFYQQDEELQKQQQDQGGAVPTSQGSSLLGAGSGAPNGAASSAPQAAAPDNPGNFVGVKTYLDANKNQASKLGDQASSVIGTSAQGARDSLNNLNTSFNTAAGGPQVFNPEITQKVNQGAENLSADEKSQIKNQYNAQYTGPQNLTDPALNDQYGDAQKKLSTAKTNVQNSGTEEGRKSLISQINSAPRTEGINNFDNILLQSGTGRDKLANAATTNQDVTQDLLGTAQTAAAEKAAANKTAADAARTQTQQVVGDATTNFNKQFDKNDPTSKLSQQIAQALKAQSLVGDLQDNSYGLDQSTLDALGLQAGQSTYGVDPGQFFKQGDPTTWNAENFANPEDFARSQALAELSGGQGLFNPADVSKAGTANLSSVDKEGLQSAIAAKGGKYAEMSKPATIVTDPKFNSVPEQLVPAGATGNLAAGGERAYRDMVAGKTPTQLAAMIPTLEDAARNQWHDPGLNISGPAAIAKNIKAYLASLQKQLDGKYTVKKNG